MSKKEDLSVLADVIELNLFQAQCGDIAKEDKDLTKELTRWLTDPKSKTNKFRQEEVAQFDWWNLRRAMTIAETVSEYLPPASVVNSRLQELLDAIEKRMATQLLLP